MLPVICSNFFKDRSPMQQLKNTRNLHDFCKVNVNRLIQFKIYFMARVRIWKINLTHFFSKIFCWNPVFTSQRRKSRPKQEKQVNHLPDLHSTRMNQFHSQYRIPLSLSPTFHLEAYLTWLLPPLELIFWKPSTVCNKVLSIHYHIIFEIMKSRSTLDERLTTLCDHYITLRTP